MSLSSYIIAPHDPIKMRYMKLREIPKDEASKTRDHCICVDILQNDSGLHVLISHPDWKSNGGGREIENICSSLFILLDLNGLIKEKDKVFWYELSLFSFPTVRVHQIQFTREGLFLNTPHYAPLSLETSHFNLSALIRRCNSHSSPPLEEEKHQKITHPNEKKPSSIMKGKKPT